MGTSSSVAELAVLERAVVDHVFALQPGYAVGLGLHEYDGRVPDLSPEGTDRWARGADQLLSRLAALDEGGLPDGQRVDRFLLRLLLESPLFDLRESFQLDRNPMSYMGGVALTPYLVRDYAPVPDRVRSIVQILEQIPHILDVGRRRLVGPMPKPYVELAISMGSGLPGHLDEVEAFAARAGLEATVRKARIPAQAAIDGFRNWLKEDVLPRSVPDFALGAARYQRLLFVREGLETPTAALQKAGAADLARNQARLAEIAEEEKLSVDALLARLGADHPSASEVVATASRFVTETREFVRSKGLVSIPESVMVRVEETPLWGRALSTASMDSPGPFDPTPEGVYYVTPVDAAWSPTQQEEWLRSFNRTLLRNITVHEVFPGHYLQFLHLRAAEASLTRRVYRSSSFIEGWAHYTEQLAIEAGLGAPRHDAEVGEIHDALLRDCRLLSSIGLHTEGWSVERSTQLFMHEAHFDRLPAEREAMRGTFDPEYFCYTLGKLAILSARSKLLASHFGGSLLRFHDTLLALGCPPVGLLEGLLEGAKAG
jgi:uncharacterized protein (DUF885 family)